MNPCFPASRNSAIMFRLTGIGEKERSESHSPVGGCECGMLRPVNPFGQRPSSQEHKPNICESKFRHLPECAPHVSLAKLLGYMLRNFGGILWVFPCGWCWCIRLSFLSPAVQMVELNMGYLCPSWRCRHKNSSTGYAGMFPLLCLSVC